MRVTIEDGEPSGVTLKIEGRVVGAMVPELDKAWQQLATSLGSRKLSVDLRGVTYVDSTGERVLSKIHQETGAEFLADTPMTKYLATKAKRSG